MLLRRPRRKDTRTRQDRTDRRNNLFASVLEGMVDEYMYWKATRGEGSWENRVVPSPAEEDVLERRNIRVIDIFRSCGAFRSPEAY